MNEPQIDLRGPPNYNDRAFAKMTAGAAGLVLVILGLIAITITRRSLPVFHEMGLGWPAPDVLRERG